MNTLNKTGYWKTDENGLPCFEYTGNIPYKAKLNNSTGVKLPEDPWFLLGNYHITLFTHISGEYELISGQRLWARINQGSVPNSDSNCSNIVIDGNEIRLTGLDAIASNVEKSKRIFGCGFANYSYEIDGDAV